jgi:hypothetical protein
MTLVSEDSSVDTELWGLRKGEQELGQETSLRLAQRASNSRYATIFGIAPSSLFHMKM